MLDFLKTYAMPLSIVTLALSIFSFGNVYFTLNRYELVPMAGGNVYLIDKQNGIYTLSAISSVEASYSFTKELEKPIEESVILKTAYENRLKELGINLRETTTGEVVVPPKSK